jgi:hypothetical protein
MSFDIANEPAADTRGTCSVCGARCVPVVTHSRRIETNVLTGAFRWVQWSSCGACNAKDQARWDEQRRDEERERREREERIAKQHERDQQRNEKRRSA